MPARDRPAAYAHPVLRILDARTGELVPAAPARRGLTRVEAHACGPDPTSLRVLLTADLLARALELDGTPVWTTLAAPHGAAGLNTAATTLSIRPFEDARDLTPGLPRTRAIQVTADRTTASGPGPVMQVAPVEWTGEEPVSGRNASSPGSGAATGRAAEPGSEQAGADTARLLPDALLADPAALRLALLSVPRRERVRLDPGALAEAGARLARWRRAVAGWARQPSRPVPEEVRERLRSAWEDDLDLPGVLDVLRDVERDPDLPDGARFETYVYADRLPALDLARDLGSPA
ncbi:hypothetical protein [Streptomyces sp. NPDC048192]|jgi:hypothetical protein|uniref:hypothetical protein n=1 Tax=Streptomyces sp. NPDC048192 TaxID=3365510 RepID=UPI003723F456